MPRQPRAGHEHVLAHRHVGDDLHVHAPRPRHAERGDAGGVDVDRARGQRLDHVRAGFEGGDRQVDAALAQPALAIGDEERRRADDGDDADADGDPRLRHGHARQAGRKRGEAKAQRGAAVKGDGGHRQLLRHSIHLSWDQGFWDHDAWPRMSQRTSDQSSRWKTKGLASATSAPAESSCSFARVRRQLSSSPRIRVRILFGFGANGPLAAMRLDRRGSFAGILTQDGKGQPMADNIFRGLIPALMTPCGTDGAPDFDALARKGRELSISACRRWSIAARWATGRSCPTRSGWRASSVWRRRACPSWSARARRARSGPPRSPLMRSGWARAG